MILVYVNFYYENLKATAKLLLSRVTKLKTNKEVFVIGKHEFNEGDFQNILNFVKEKKLMKIKLLIINLILFSTLACEQNTNKNKLKTQK